MKLISWNINGVRASLRYGLADYLKAEAADVVCLQEVRAPVEALAPLVALGYHAFVYPAEKKGYSRVAILSRVTPRAVFYGMGVPELDREGRVVTAEFAGFYLVSAYVPNAQPGLARLPFRLEWDAAFLAYLRSLDASKPVVFCGDLNVAHQPIDLARPTANVGNPGFSDEERAAFAGFLAAGFLDTFREFEPGPGHYTWWSVATGARARNIGWRIDYFLMSGRMRPALRGAFIRAHVTGSDHCPVGIELEG